MNLTAIQIEQYDFGSIETYADNILVIVIKQGLEVNAKQAGNIIQIIANDKDTQGLLIVDRRYNYSYTGEGMALLNDSNLPFIKATANITHSTLSKIITLDQIEIMKEMGRNNLFAFNSLETAFAWAKQLQKP